MSMNSKESIYGFIGWLTGRDQVTRIGASENCGGLPDLIEEFAATNKLPEISEDWPNNLIHPSGECSHSNAGKE